MSRSKSPDKYLEKAKTKLRSSGSSHHGFPVISVEKSKLTLNSHQSRLNLLSKHSIFKNSRKKKSISKLRTPQSKSPSNSVIYQTKDELMETSLSLLYLHGEHRKLEEILKHIEKLDIKSVKNSENDVNFDRNQIKFDAFNELFEEVILRDKAFSKYLQSIKRFFDEYYKNKLELIVKNNTKQINELTLSVKSKEDEIASLQRSLEKLSVENLELSKEIEAYEMGISSLKQELSAIHEFDIELLPKNSTTWKFLVMENGFYTRLCKDLNKEIEVYKYNQEMFLKKFDELKDKGIEVSYEFSENISLSESQNLSSGHEEILQYNLRYGTKDQRVPSLNFTKVSNQSSLTS